MSQFIQQNNQSKLMVPQMMSQDPNALGDTNVR